MNHAPRVAEHSGLALAVALTGHVICRSETVDTGHPRCVCFDLYVYPISTLPIFKVSNS